jgi:diguanylate cyclase (GGDEF)-like protein
LDACLAGWGLVLLLCQLLRPGRLVQHLSLLSATAGATAIITQAATAGGSVSTAISYLWVTLFAAFFLGPRFARAYSALNVAGLVTATTLQPYAGAGHVVVVLAVTVVVAGEAIGAAVRRLEAQADTDALTGLLNRRGLQERGEIALDLARRSGKPVTAAIFDLDGFKAINDQRGHAAGDAVLVDLAQRWTPLLRRSDLLARQGGDEFVLLLPGTDRPGAQLVIDRLRAANATAWSVGIAQARETEDLGDVLVRADHELYAAKGLREGLPRQRLHSSRAGESG